MPPRRTAAPAKALAIQGLAVLAAVAYGVVHDQITARICVEYFTIGHLPVFGTEDPTLLGLGWGVLATWWVGLFLGSVLAIAARAGGRPPVGARALARPIAVLLGVMGGCAAAAGVLGWLLATRGAITLEGRLAVMVPAAKHVPFLADAWAHRASYLAGVVGGIVLAVRTWRGRARAAVALASPASGAAVRERPAPGRP